MNKNFIVHIVVIEKFIPPFVDFVNEYFDMKKHLFVVLGKRDDTFGKLDAENMVFIDKNIKALKLILYMNRADKIILHGLWSHRLNQVLFINPWLYKKCYWVMWGGDFYFPEKQSSLQRYTIKKINHFVTYIKGDYDLVKKWYGAKGTYHECFMYTSNLYKDYDMPEVKHQNINIQVGNSADPTNNHSEAFDKLEKYKDTNINIYVPLSYGDKEYAKEVIIQGKRIFGDKFKPLVDFMSFENYLDFLANIDIAIFAHERQQAMGNTITLLGLGKKVYMRSDVTPWSFFNTIDVKIFDLENINLDLFNEKLTNQKIIKEYFSEENLVFQWKSIFEINNDE